MSAVRRATFDDVEDLVEIGRRAHEASVFGRHAFDDDIARVLVARLLNSKSGVIFVAHHFDKMVGFLLGKVDSLPYVPTRVATDIAFYAEQAGSGRALLTAFEAWAKGQKATDILMGVSFGGRSARGAEALYRRAGFEHAGGIFVKRGDA